VRVVVTKHIVVSIVLVLGVASRAAAEPDQPWAVGVSEEQRGLAQRLLEAGNDLFLEKRYAEALDRYRAALAHWDHPAIRFNIVRCLIQLDRPAEASDNLALALKYGSAPLDESVYAEAQGYRKLLANQIAELEVVCDQGGSEVTLDGQPVLSCPGKQVRRVVPGHHQLVATRPGFLTRTLDVVLIGGKHEVVPIALVPLASAARITHRWPTWVPWGVLGGGVVIAGVGGLIELEASSELDAYNRSVAQKCSMMACNPSDLDTRLRDRALLANKLAIGVIASGAATMAISGALFYLNRGRTTYDTATELRGPTVSVSLQPGGAGVAVVGRF
jgi:tetratricopeptide (TPR) repeat protein